MMTLDLSDRPWWKEPMVWLIACLPATAVVAGLPPTSSPPTNRTAWSGPNIARKVSRWSRRPPQADTLAAELGLVARMAVNNGKLELDLKSRLDIVPARVSLTIIHPTRRKVRIFISSSWSDQAVIPTARACRMWATASAFWFSRRKTGPGGLPVNGWRPSPA
jgi:hypothetical protein